MALLMSVAMFVMQDDAAPGLRTLLRWYISPAKQITLTETAPSFHNMEH